MSEFDIELEKAREFRRKMQAREDDRLARERALAGNETAAAQLREKTYALIGPFGWSPKKRVIDDGDS